MLATAAALANGNDLPICTALKRLHVFNPEPNNPSARSNPDTPRRNTLSPLEFCLPLVEFGLFAGKAIKCRQMFLDHAALFGPSRTYSTSFSGAKSKP
jgi:hypothetical protein